MPAGGDRAWPLTATCPARLEAAARPAGPGHCTQHDKRHRCDGRRRVRRARAGFGTQGQTTVPAVGGKARPLTAISTARLEAAARPAGPGRASRRRAERSSRRGRLAGGQDSQRPEIRRHHKQQNPGTSMGSGVSGGGWGIRTPEGLHPTRFPSVRHRPLGESS